MNLPNKITLSRIVLAFIFMFLLFSQGITARYLALFTFILAAFTDFLDGCIARRNKMENDFGRLMDPIADKILILAGILAFVEMKIVPAWMAVVIVFRELLITGLRIIAASRGLVLSASLAGKQKTVSQMVAVILILVFLIIKESACEFWDTTWELWFRRGVFYLMLVTVIFTVISGFSYLIRSKNILFGNREKSC